MVSLGRNELNHVNMFSNMLTLVDVLVLIDFELGYRKLKWMKQVINMESDLDHINGLMQERHNSIANALKLRLFCIIPSIFWWMRYVNQQAIAGATILAHKSLQFI